MLRIIGYHIPATMDKYQSLIIKSFNLPPVSKSSPVTFESGIVFKFNAMSLILTAI
jgi:hypothetical protein